MNYPIFTAVVLILTSLICAADAPLSIRKSADGAGFYIYLKPEAGTNRVKNTGWLEKEAARLLIDSKKAPTVTDLQKQQDVLTNSFNLGIIRLGKNESEALLLNRAAQREWVQIQKKPFSRNCHYVFADSNMEMAPSVGVVGWWAAADNPAAIADYKRFDCNSVVSDFTRKKGPEQVCYGHIRCDEGKKNKFCACQVTEKMTVRKDARCPSADDCLKQCERGVSPSGWKILADQSPGLKTDVKGDALTTLKVETKAPPLRIGNSEAGFCFYNDVTINGSGDWLSCITTEAHCPSAKACLATPCSFTHYALFKPYAY